MSIAPTHSSWRENGVLNRIIDADVPVRAFYVAGHRKVVDHAGELITAWQSP